MVSSDFQASCLHPPLLCEISCETRARRDASEMAVSASIVH